VSTLSWMSISTNAMTQSSTLGGPCLLLTTLSTLSANVSSSVEIVGNTCLGAGTAVGLLMAGGVVTADKSSLLFARCNKVDAAPAVPSYPTLFTVAACGTCNIVADCFEPNTQSVTTVSGACSCLCYGTTTGNCFGPLASHELSSFFVPPSSTSLACGFTLAGSNWGQMLNQDPAGLARSVTNDLATTLNVTSAAISIVSLAIGSLIVAFVVQVPNTVTASASALSSAISGASFLTTAQQYQATTGNAIVIMVSNVTSTPVGSSSVACNTACLVLSIVLSVFGVVLIVVVVAVIVIWRRKNAVIAKRAENAQETA